MAEERRPRVPGPRGLRLRSPTPRTMGPLSALLPIAAWLLASFIFKGRRTPSVGPAADPAPAAPVGEADEGRIRARAGAGGGRPPPHRRPRLARRPGEPRGPRRPRRARRRRRTPPSRHRPPSAPRSASPATAATRRVPARPASASACSPAPPWTRPLRRPPLGQPRRRAAMVKLGRAWWAGVVVALAGLVPPGDLFGLTVYPLPRHQRLCPPAAPSSHQPGVASSRSPFAGSINEAIERKRFQDSRETRIRGARPVLLFAHSTAPGRGKALHSLPEGQAHT